MFLYGLETKSLFDPSTAADSCGRSDGQSILAPQRAVNQARLKVWAARADSFFAGPAVIDAVASLVPTDAETKEDTDISYDDVWGYSAVLVSRANTQENLSRGLLDASPVTSR